MYKVYEVPFFTRCLGDALELSGDAPLMEELGHGRLPAYASHLGHAGDLVKLIWLKLNLLLLFPKRSFYNKSLALYMEECMDGNHKKWNKDGPEKYSKPSKLVEEKHCNEEGGSHDGGGVGSLPDFDVDMVKGHVVLSAKN